MKKIDLMDLESMLRAGLDCHRDVTLALIEHVRELRTFIAAVPDAILQADKVHRDDFPGLFADTGDCCMAMYMDAARAKLLERGVVLP